LSSLWASSLPFIFPNQAIVLLSNSPSPGRLSVDFRIHKLDKIVGGGEGKEKYPARQCKVCAAHKK